MGNRKHERRPVSVQVVLAVENASPGLETVEGELIDISQGGAGVILHVPASAREDFLKNTSQLTLLRPEQQRMGRFPVEAVWVDEPDETHASRSGFRFVEEPGIAHRVAEFLTTVPTRPKPLFE